MKRALFCLICLLVLQWSTPFWWWIAVVPLLFGLCLPGSAWIGFRTGMLGAGVLWLSVSLVLIFTKSARIIQSIPEVIGIGKPVYVLAVTVCAASLTGGFAGLTGALARRVFFERQDS